ncbi:MAG: hypothetical protein WBE48_01615, partial [Xanthobacteraceae bacterium]
VIVVMMIVVVMVMVVCRAEPYAKSRMMMMVVVMIMTHLHRDLREFCAGILSPSLRGFIVSLQLGEGIGNRVKEIPIT